jgi:hypothetical protein
MIVKKSTYASMELWIFFNHEFAELARYCLGHPNIIRRRGEVIRDSSFGTELVFGEANCSSGFLTKSYF